MSHTSQYEEVHICVDLSLWEIFISSSSSHIPPHFSLLIQMSIRFYLIEILFPGFLISSILSKNFATFLSFSIPQVPSYFAQARLHLVPVPLVLSSEKNINSTFSNLP